MTITYQTENQTIRAYHNSTPIGKVSVQDIRLHWANGAMIPLAGIGGVGTDEAHRGQGIAGHMMAAAKTFAREKGYACSGLTTNLYNNARRLYTRAGYTLIFKPGRYAKTLHPIRPTDVPGLTLRPYREADERAFQKHFTSQHQTFFGYRDRTPESWHDLRAKYLAEEPDAFRVAEADGQILGWTSIFRKWVGLCSEVCTLPDRGRDAVAQTLLAHLETHHLSQERSECHIWASPQDAFLHAFLSRNGYTFREMRVFQLHIIDLPKLLTQLLPIFQDRLAEPPWTGALKITTPDHQAVLHIADQIAVTSNGAAHVELHTDTPTLCRLLTGAIPPYDAYLETLLSITPRYTAEIDGLLKRLFPPLNHFHPADDLW